MAVTDTEALEARRASQIAFVQSATQEPLPPPMSHSGAVGWIRANLISGPMNIVLTILSVLLIAWIVPPMIKFLFIDAVWSGADRDACTVTAERPHVGACWAFVRDRFSYFVYGSYPISQRWRVDIFFAML
ncbi:MAG: amino acid ABC transporter permease, partial [Pseudorhodoplanes sp.]